MTGNRLDGSTASIQMGHSSLLAITDTQRTTNPEKKRRSNMDEDQVRAIVLDEIAKLIGPPLTEVINAAFEILGGSLTDLFSSQITNLGEELGGES